MIYLNTDAGASPGRVERTVKRPGDVEFVWCPKARDYVPHVYEGEPARAPVARLRRVA